MNYLYDFIKKELPNVPKPVNAVLGLDPSIGTTGYALILIDSSGNIHFVDSGVIKTNPKDTHTKRLGDLYLKVLNYLKLVTDLLYLSDIKIVGAGIEIPAVFLKKNRFSRDLVQRDACTACRMAVGTMGINVAGDEKDTPIRPNQIHALGDANKKGLGKELDASDRSKLKKNMVKNALEKMCIMYKKIKKLDESDALGCAVVAWKKFYVKLV